jgi:hypothetical protein
MPGIALLPTDSVLNWQAIDCNGEFCHAKNVVFSSEK